MIDIELVNKTIYDCLNECANTNSNNTGLEYEDELFSWNDLDLLSDRIAVVFMRKGIYKGTHVGIWSMNSPNWIITFLALTKLGAIPVLINSCYKEEEVSRVIEYADIKFLCYGDGYQELIYEDIVRRIIPKVSLKHENCIPIGKSNDASWNGLKIKYKDITQCELNKVLEFKKNVYTHDTACIFFTSGTTKMPKGVMLSHYSLVNNSLEIARNMNLTNKDKMCLAVPLFHCFGITASLLVAIHSRCTIHLLKCYKSLDVFENIHKNKCTVLNGVPSMFLAMMHNKERDKYDLSSVKSGIIAGSHISYYDYLKICEVFKLSYLQPSYGQTEASPCITISDYQDSLEIKAKTVGKKIKNISLRIYDENRKKELKLNEIGEVQTKGYHIMQGYYNLPLETKETFTEDGWLKTGDLGYLDDNGYLHIVGRNSEMIIRGGENISPVEIEECIRCFSKVKDVKVVGIKADVLQEEIAACIIPINEELDIDELSNFIRSRLSHYKVPRYILKFESFPSTASGKIKIGELKKIADKIVNKK